MRIRFLIPVSVLLMAGLLLLTKSLASSPAATPTLRINEFLADNDGVIADEDGEYDDVIELYNPGPDAVDLGGLYLSDTLADPTKFRITDGLTIPAAGYVLFWADSSPEQGVYHANFSLSKAGESIGLFDRDENGNAALDTYSFGQQATDVSEGRCPDGGSRWLFFQTPTMGVTNEPCGTPPAILGVEQVPASPQAGEGVTVTATITDDDLFVAATLWYSAGTAYQDEEMSALGGDRFAAQIPGQPEGTWVQYYVTAEDDAGWRSAHPPTAPATAHSYVAGYDPPSVALNELMADNQATLQDPDEPGEYPDWLELYNTGQDPVDLGGLFLTDDPANPQKSPLSAGMILPGGGFAVLYADGEPEQGSLHTNFKLSADGETLALYGAGGRVRIDSIAFPALAADVSYGRWPDGSGAWRTMVLPTPGWANGACCRVWLPLIGRAAGPLELPLRIDCGSDAPYTTLDGTTYRADQPWTAGTALGYVGGFADTPTEWWQGNPVGGTGDPLLYKTQRRAWQEYRVGRIPNGDYLLTLRFEEQGVHGPGLSVFDVDVEGQTLLDDVDIWAEVGRYHTLDRRLAVAVADGELNLTAAAQIGESHLAALELVPRAPDQIAPAVPGGVVASASYAGVLLDWTDNGEEDLQGYYVYRADKAEGPYTRLPAMRPIGLSRYEDAVDVAHVDHYYRVAAVDAYGNESGQSSPLSAAALDPSDATLPFYQLAVAPADLQVLYANPWSDNVVAATFTVAGQTVPAQVRFRGSAGRTFPKKSWKVKFPGDSPFPYHDEINVNAYWLDESLIHSALASGLFEAAGLHPPQAEHALLAVNGQFEGVYTRNEQIDEGFLIRTGRNPGASIYKVVDRFGEILPDEAAYRAYYEKKTNENLGYADIIDLVELLNNTPDDVFATSLAAVMDVEAFLRYYALLVLTANIDQARHNIYLVHDLVTDRWEFLPWDLEIGFVASAAPVDMGTEDHPEGPGGSNILRTRVLRVPEFRTQYCAILAEYMGTIFSNAAMYPKIEAVHAQIREDGIRDWHKLPWEQSDVLTASKGAIQSFVTQRRQFLLGELTSFCPAP